MSHPHLLVKTLTIASALLLGTTFLMYRTGNIQSLFPSANVSPTKDLPLQQKNKFMLGSWDTSEIKKRLPLLDSAQRAYLERVQQQYPPAEGTSLYDREYLTDLPKTIGKKHSVLAASSKSGQVIASHNLEVEQSFQLYEILRILQSDTSASSQGNKIMVTTPFTPNNVIQQSPHKVNPMMSSSKSITPAIPIPPLDSISPNKAHSVDSNRIMDTTSSKGSP